MNARQPRKVFGMFCGRSGGSIMLPNHSESRADDQRSYTKVDTNSERCSPMQPNPLVITARSLRATLFQRTARCASERVSRATFHGLEFNPRKQDRQICLVHHDMIGVSRTARSLKGAAL